MTYVPLNNTDNWSTSRATINSNFSSVDTQLADKVQFTGTAPVDWDLTVFSGITGKVLKKKVFTASQVVESDSNGQLTSAAKGTGYNLNLGTTAGTVLEGSNDALYAKLAWDQTIAGVKTFTSIPVWPASDPTTDNQLARKFYVDSVAAATFSNWTTTKDASDASTTQNIAHGLGRTPKKVKIRAWLISASWSVTWTLTADTVYNGTTQSSFSIIATASGSWYITWSSDFNLNWNFSAWTNSQVWVVTFDSTNIIITWTKTGSPSGTYTLLWEAQ